MKAIVRQSFACMGRQAVRYLVFGLPFIAALALICLAVPHFVQFNTSPSMPLGWYLRLPAWNIRVGDLIEFDNPLSQGSFGVELTTGIFKRVESIEDGMYRVVGDDIRSYDSRFYGLLGKEYVRHKLVPLATFSEIPEWMRNVADFKLFDI